MFKTSLNFFIKKNKCANPYGYWLSIKFKDKNKKVELKRFVFCK